MKKKNMKKKSSNMIIITIILIAMAIIEVALFCIPKMQKWNEENVKSGKNEKIVNPVKEEFVEVLEDGTRLNTSTKLQEVKKFEGLEISNLQVTENNNVTLLLGTITNISQTKQGGYPVNITIIDKNGNEIITISAFIGELEVGESTQLSTNVTFNYANAYDLRISKIQ